MIIGITGPIAAGKSRAAVILRRIGWVVHDSDQAVHRAYRNPAVISRIADHLPSVIRAGQIDRQALADRIIKQAEVLDVLENIVHPIVREDLVRNVQLCLRHRRRGFIIDSPLLYEAGLDSWCDRVIRLATPARIRRMRVARRSARALALFDLFESRRGRRRTSPVRGARRRRWSRRTHHMNQTNHADAVIQGHGDSGSNARLLRRLVQGWLRSERLRSKGGRLPQALPKRRKVW